MKIVFMGTPDFAVSILDRIIQEGHEIALVVTTPDKPAGRGQHIKCSAVKTYAVEHKLPIAQPERLKDDTFICQLQTLQADVFVVVAFRMLPKEVYTIPPKGTFNIHASLLPQYRGAAPIQWSIINGEEKTGVTTFFLNEHTDTGDIILQREVEITNTDTAGTLHDKLMTAGAEIAIETLSAIQVGTANTYPQVATHTVKTAPKIFKNDMLINWDNTAVNIYNKIRGLSPYPTAYTRITPLNNLGESTDKITSIKIYQVSISKFKSNSKPGTIRITDNKEMLVSTKDFDISIDSLQIEGKKQMAIEDFLSGFRKNNYTDILF